jgi:pimeloyl-ACP methyl ester carboxylesterase
MQPPCRANLPRLCGRAGRLRGKWDAAPGRLDALAGPVSRSGMIGAPTESFVEASGLRHHLLTWDGGGSTTLLIVHGFLDHAWSMMGLARALPDDAHVVALDLRGHGDSGWVGAGGWYHSPDYVLDVSDVMAQVRRDRLVLVGHSLGGIITGYTAGTFPAAMDAVVMIEGLGVPDSDFREAPPRYEAYVRTVRERRAKTPRPMADLDEVARRLQTTCPRIAPELLAEIAVHAVRPAPDGAGWLWKFDPLHRARGPIPFYLPHYAAFLDRIRCPALLVEAAESTMQFTPEETARRSALVRGGTRVVIPDSGHMVHVEAPEALARAITGFLAPLGL